MFRFVFEVPVTAPPLLRLDCELTKCEPGEEETTFLAQKHQQSPIVVQTLCFTELPAEIRNRIYELSLPKKTDELIVSTPFRDVAMTLATQPALTRVSRQVRYETLKMFYKNSTFVAYIDDFNFARLAHWAHCVTSGHSPPQISVDVKLLSRIRYIEKLLNLARRWREISHGTLHLRIHNCYAGRPVLRLAFDQRELVVRTIELAESLREEGDHSEAGLIREFRKRFGRVQQW